MPQPTSGEPVNVMSAMSSVVDDRVADRAAAPGDDVEVPGREPALGRAAARPRAMADSGVCDAGLSTTGHPAAIAGASLCATRFSGKLNGLIAPTTPIGTRSVNPSFPSPTSDASIGTISPVSRARLGCGERERRHRALRLDPRGLDRLGGLLGDDAGELLGALGEQLRGAVEDLGALPRRERAVAVHRRRVRRPRAPPRRAARGDAVDLVTVVGRAHDELVAVLEALDPVVADREGPHGAAFRVAGDGSSQRRMGRELELAVEHLLEERALAAGAPDLELGVVDACAAATARATA